MLCSNVKLKQEDQQFRFIDLFNVSCWFLNTYFVNCGIERLYNIQ